MDEQDLEDSFRIDFDLQVIATDDETRFATIAMIPKPERYEWREVEGRRYLYDRLDKRLIPEKVWRDMARELVGGALYRQAPLVDDILRYLEERARIAASRLEGAEETPTFEDKSEQFLRRLLGTSPAFVILSLDVVGSTKMATSLDPKVYSRMMAVLLAELGELVPLYHGHVLKYTGDGIIAYFPEPTFVAKNDLALSCALALRQLVYKAINDVFCRARAPNCRRPDRHRFRKSGRRGDGQLKDQAACRPHRKGRELGVQDSGSGGRRGRLCWRHRLAELTHVVASPLQGDAHPV